MVLSRPQGLVLLACLLGAVTGAAQAAPPPDGTGYQVRAADVAELKLDAPHLPDLSAYTAQGVAAKLIRQGAARVSVKRMVESPALHEFIAGHGRMVEWASRQNTNPVALFIDGGTITPGELAKLADHKNFEETEPGVFVARLPVVIGKDAALNVGEGTRELRLSQDRGAFLVNEGQLFITGTRLVGWSERDGKPAAFAGKASAFRPFVVSWGGSQTFISRSVIASLGYDASKSFGVTVSQYAEHEDHALHRARPGAWIIDSEFSDNWVGVFAYEADAVVVLRNQFHDNIAGAIDAHARSRGAIIAHNSCSGSRQQHGILLADAVSDSFVFHNKSFSNHGAGIALERGSSGNVIADNEVYGNQGDGIALFESPDNLLWTNRVIGNAHHGIRLRNSVEIRLYGNEATGNRMSGIFGDVKEVAGAPNAVPPSAEQKLSMLIVGGKLMFNGSGPVSIDKPLSLELYDVDLLAPAKNGGIALNGVLGDHQRDLLDILVRQHLAAVIEPVGGHAALKKRPPPRTADALAAPPAPGAERS